MSIKPENIRDALWWTHGNMHIGVVLYDTGFGMKVYWGVVRPDAATAYEHTGEMHDAIMIAEAGARVHKPICWAMFPQVKPQDWYEHEEKPEGEMEEIIATSLYNRRQFEDAAFVKRLAEAGVRVRKE